MMRMGRESDALGVMQLMADKNVNCVKLRKGLIARNVLISCTGWPICSRTWVGLT